MRFVILHYHLFKNAGSTIENMLDRNFGERFYRLDTADRDGRLSEDVLLSYLKDNLQIQAISSHHLRHPVPAARGFLFFDLCFFRDPLDRIRSIYDYLHVKPSVGDPLSDLAGRWSLGEFVPRVIEAMPHHVNDVQVNLLANAGDYKGPPGRADCDCALKRMLETSWLGVVDRFNESIIGGQNLLDPAFPGMVCAVPPVNASGGLDDALQLRLLKLEKACGSRVYSDLVRLNILDRELLRKARAEVARRFTLVPNRKARLQSLAWQLQDLKA